jgi:hypothetical protein
VVLGRFPVPDKYWEPVVGGLAPGEDTGLWRGVDWALVVALPRFEGLAAACAILAAYVALVRSIVGLELGVDSGLLSGRCVYCGRIIGFGLVGREAGAGTGKGTNGAGG